MIGYLIKNLRIVKNMSQKELAYELSISASSIKMYEQHKCQPSAGTIVKFAHFFNVTTDYLLGVTEYDSIFTNKIMIAVSKDEEKIIKLLRKLDFDYKDIVKGELMECVKLQELEHYNIKKQPAKKLV